MTARHTNDIDCTKPEVGALLIQYGLGTLDERDCEQFEHHLLECRACQEELDSAADALDLMHEQRSAFERKVLSEKEDFNSLLERRKHLLHARPSMDQTGQEAERGVTRGINWFRWILAPAVGVAAVLLVVFQFRSSDSPENAHMDSETKASLIEEFRGNPATLVGLLGVSRSTDTDSALASLLSLYESGNMNSVLERTSALMNGSQNSYAAQMLRGGAFLLARPDSAYACFLRAQGLAPSAEQRTDAAVYAARAAASAGDYGTAGSILSQFATPESNRRTFAEKWVPLLDSLAREQQAP